METELVPRTLVVRALSVAARYTLFILQKGIMESWRLTGQGVGMLVEVERCPNCCLGRTIPEDRRCQQCHGEGKVYEYKDFELKIEPGVASGYCIVFQGEASELAGVPRGDVRFTLKQQAHPTFRRHGNHLFLRKEITLYETLTGYAFIVDQLDGRKLLIRSSPGDVTQHSTRRVIHKEGLPTYASEKGNMLIEIHVRMPATESDMHRTGEVLKQTLRMVLPAPAPLDIREKEEDVEVHVPQEATPQDFAVGGDERQQRFYPVGGYGAEGLPASIQCRQQ